MARFAAVYFLSFLTLGVYLPWLPPLLAARGLSPRAIGVGLGMVSLARAVLPPAWGLVADRMRRQHLLLAFVMGAAGLCLLPLALPLAPSAVLVVLGVYGFFLAPALPLTEVLTLRALGASRERYGQVRLWGSVGFIVTTVAMGRIIGHFGVETVPVALAWPMFAAGALALTLPPPLPTEDFTAPVARAPLPWRALWPILAVALFGQASHSPYYAFFTLGLTEAGAGTDAIGGLWALAVVAEIGVMIYAPRLFAKVGLVAALRVALALAALRWLILATTHSLWLVTLSQPLHAASYAVVHMTTLQLVDELAPERSRALAQTVFAAVAYGIGVGGGQVLAGLCAPSVGYSGLYVGAALLSLLGLAASSRCRGRGALATPVLPRA